MTDPQYPPSGQPYSGQQPAQGYPQQGYPQQSHPQQDSPPQGFPQQGLPPQGFSQQSFPQQGFPPQGFAQQPYPPQGYPPQSYPQQPYPAAGYPVAPQLNVAPAARPRSVDIAFQLWLTNFGLSLIGAVLAFVDARAMAQKVAQMLAGAGMDAQAIANAGQPTYGSVIFDLILLAAGLALVFAMRGGQNWARITLTVLASLSVLGVLLSIAGSVSPFAIGGLGIVQGLVSIVQVILIIGAVVFMFRSDSNAYYRMR